MKRGGQDDYGGTGSSRLLGLRRAAAGVARCHTRDTRALMLHAAQRSPKCRPGGRRMTSAAAAAARACYTRFSMANKPAAALH